MMVALAFAPSGLAQISSYLGPGVLSRGVGNIGSRSGQQSDLRLSADVSGFYDTGLLLVAVDPSGKLFTSSADYGMQAGLSAYGVHKFHRSQLGLDYSGNYRYYAKNTNISGADQTLSLGYTVQASRRLTVEMRGSAGELINGNNGLYGYASESFDPNSSLLFDNRTFYLQGGMDVTYSLTPRTYFQVGGYGFVVRRAAAGLVGVNGYDLRGSLSHRVSRETTFGVSFDHSHFDYPRAFGESDNNAYSAFIARSLGKNWTINLSAGAFQSEVQGLQRVSLDPAVAAILGVSSGTQAFYRKYTFPTGSLSLVRRFRSATATVAYSRSITPGNGVYLTSRNEQASANFSYTGIQKWSFSFTAAYSKLGSLGQDIANYSQTTAGGGATFALTRAIHLTARFDDRRNEIDLVNGFKRNSYRATFGLGWSPGDIPVSLW